MDTLILIGKVTAAAIAGAIVMLNIIAPLTKTDVDNKVLDALRWVEDKLLAVVLPQHVAFKKSDVIVETIEVPEPDKLKN